jgi:hypothetical protein
MTTQVDAILVGKWRVGTAESPSKATVLMLEFKNRAPINLAFLPDQAVAIAKGDLEQ